MYSNNFSRTSSTGSIDNMLSPTSSSQNTDNSPTTEDSDSDHKSATSYKERRREAHTQAEQKRRDAIKRGYEDLQSLVPKCQQQDSVSSYKLSKASILQRSIDYIQFLQQQNRDLDEKRQSLRKETIALQIMKTNYEQMVKHHQDTQPGQPCIQVSDAVKVQVFQALCDQLFRSFDASVPTDNFADLSRCVFSWLEEKCTPNTLKQLTANILSQLPSD